MAKVSVLVPSRGERFLQRTIDDVLAKATGEIEIIPILDGDLPAVPLMAHPLVRVLSFPKGIGLRAAVNAGVEAATGEYVLKLDAHCAIAPGFDEALQASCDDDWVVVPRRYSLDVDTWGIYKARPSVDYEYLLFPYRDMAKGTRLGNTWFERRQERQGVALDDDPCFQGSAYFFTKRHFQRMGPYRPDLFTNFMLESEELTNKTWLSGGRVVVNKMTWYAHLHKGSVHRRGYFLAAKTLRRGRYAHETFWFCQDGWLPGWPERVHHYDWLVEKFDPMPGWPSDWRTHIADHKWVGPRYLPGQEPAV